ncbi:MAG: phospho-sugar mutase [Ornithinimicrobium sp.]|uniref:phospho-sugar mutase n=1 Tax=Ornithinimicrobium sp. TaxID=1977084 RepID=UPI003D9BC491
MSGGLQVSGLAPSIESDDALLAQARAWLADDPDAVTRDELTAVIEAAEGSGDTADLADRFSGPLEFGTAGLRGEMGAGPHRMNRAVVIRAAAGLTAYLLEHVGPEPTVVIGFDARHRSADFARDTAAVVTAAGGRALLLPEPLPTPVLAFAIGHLGADAAVMVTASHNPPQDNGYKVYLGDGSQIVPPADAQIAAHIEAVPSVGAVPRAEEGWTRLGEDVLEAYLDGVAAVVSPDSPREVSLVHTALHGVGAQVIRRAFERAGYPAPEPVAEQETPDPDFPTVGFPNPEEPGAIDAALALADIVHPDAVIANDPDADRCAVAVDGPRGWQMLRGDEVGALLAHHLLRRGLDPGSSRTVLARSIVSSRLLAAMAEDAGLPSAETLTGFKWIGRVPGLAYGYEEALGYCVDPARVPDKDGVSAALLMSELIATTRAEGRSLWDVLDDLALRHGVHATDAFSVRVQDLSRIGAVLQRLRAEQVEEIAGVAVERLDDLAQGSADLPPTEGLRYLLADDTRVIVRPSGTEPKLKVYLEAIVPVSEVQPLGASRQEADRRLAAVRVAMEDLTRTN